MKQPYITIPALNDLVGIGHGFFTRIGGVSSGVFASLNCAYGTGDDPNNVTENRRRAMAHLDLTHDQLVTVHQIHSSKVVTIDTPLSADQLLQADGLVTAYCGIALGVLTADCAPLLFVDVRRKIIGTAHAGWRGTLTGVIEETIEQMIRLKAQREHILVGMGPCITQPSYEVGSEVSALFLAQDRSNAEFFVASKRRDRFMFDLGGVIARRIKKAGVSFLQHKQNTFTEETSFFSARRSSLRNQRSYGCCLSTIVIQG